jgi:methyl-accepting chemotaxis protein
MIEGSIKKVEIGSRIARETAGALDSIVSEIARATELIAAIAYLFQRTDGGA